MYNGYILNWLITKRDNYKGVETYTKEIYVLNNFLQMCFKQFSHE